MIARMVYTMAAILQVFYVESPNVLVNSVETRKGHFGTVGAEWRTEFARRNRTESHIQGLATTHHAEVRKLHASTR
jgi:hypothetical protein